MSMKPRSNEQRRMNPSMAESVQIGVSLLFVAGKEDARRYLVKCRVPAHVIERVLSAPPGARRPYGSHGTNDRRKVARTVSAKSKGPPHSGRQQLRPCNPGQQHSVYGAA